MNFNFFRASSIEHDDTRDSSQSGLRSWNTEAEPETRNASDEEMTEPKNTGVAGGAGGSRSEEVSRSASRRRGRRIVKKTSSSDESTPPQAQVRKTMQATEGKFLVGTKPPTELITMSYPIRRINVIPN